METEIDKRLESLPKREASFVKPMECLSVSKLPEGSQWLWEIKLDGYRALAVKSGSSVTLFSRRRKSLNRQFPYIVESLADLPEGTVVDGELLAIDDSGRPDFNLLQNFRAEASRIHYYVFDLLCWKDRDLTRLPLIERRALLKSLLAIRDKRIRTSDYVEAAPNDLLFAVREQGLEGITLSLSGLEPDCGSSRFSSIDHRCVKSPPCSFRFLRAAGNSLFCSQTRRPKELVLPSLHSFQPSAISSSVPIKFLGQFGASSRSTSLASHPRPSSAAIPTVIDV